MLISCCPVCVAEHAAAVCKTYQDKADTLRTEFIRRSMRCKFIPVSILTTAVLYYTFLCFACCFVLILAHSDFNVSHFVHIEAASMQGYLYDIPHLFTLVLSLPPKISPISPNLSELPTAFFIQDWLNLTN